MGSRTRRNENINEVFLSSMIYCVARAVSFVNLLNHFGKIGCKGDGVSVTELRGHKIQGQLVTLRANKKANVGGGETGQAKARRERTACDHPLGRNTSDWGGDKIATRSELGGTAVFTSSDE